MSPRRIAALVCIAILGACVGDSREKLIVYSPHGKEMLSAFEDAFEAEYPEVDVQWIDMGGQDAYDRIRTERANSQASLWWGGAETTFSRAAREGLLEQYRPTWADAVVDDARHPEDYWYGTFYTPEVIAYNVEAIAREEVPKDWDALLDPEWHDRILIRYPMASSTMRTIYGAMILRQPTVEDGFRWLAKLDENVKTYTSDPTQLYLRLARGEGDLTVWNMTDIYLQARENGYPFDLVIPSSGTPVLTDCIALVAGGPNLDRARQFYEFVTTDSALVQQANEFYRIPVRHDIDRTALPEWAHTEITSIPLDWERLSKEGPEWMLFWDEQIKGRGTEYLAEHAAAR